MTDTAEQPVIDDHPIKIRPSVRALVLVSAFAVAVVALMGTWVAGLWGRESPSVVPNVGAVVEPGPVVFITVTVDGTVTSSPSPAPPGASPAQPGPRLSSGQSAAGPPPSQGNPAPPLGGPPRLAWGGTSPSYCVDAGTAEIYDAANDLYTLRVAACQAGAREQGVQFWDGYLLIADDPATTGWVDDDGDLCLVADAEWFVDDAYLVLQGDCDAYDEVEWQWSYDAGGKRALLAHEDPDTGHVDVLCLDLMVGGAGPTSNGSRLVATGCDGDVAQKWSLVS